MTTNDRDRPAPPRAVSTMPGAPLATPGSVQDALDYGKAAAQADLLGEGHGPNALPHTAERYRAQARVAEGLIAVDAISNAGQVYASVKERNAAALGRLATAPARLAELRQAKHDAREARDRAERLGLPTARPSRRRAQRPAVIAAEMAGAVFFAVADTMLTAPAFDLFGLSDAPLVSDLYWTDERHLTAFGVVSAMLVIAYALGASFVRASAAGGRRLEALAERPAGRAVAGPGAVPVGPASALGPAR